MCIDHIVPLSRGGQHVRANWQLAHLRCNSAKRDGPGLPHGIPPVQKPLSAEWTRRLLGPAPPQFPAPLLSITAAADLLGIRADLLRRWDADGTLRAIRLPSGQRRYRPADIQRKGELMGILPPLDRSG